MVGPETYKNRRNEELRIPGEVCLTVYSLESEAAEIYGSMVRMFKRPGLRMGSDGSEVYSPPRIALQAASFGLSPGYSLDLTVRDDNGRPWDLSDPQMQAKAIRDQDSWLLIVCPPRDMSSQLQPLSKGRIHAEEWNS